MTEDTGRLAESSAPAEPQLRSVTLYKHGVGAFRWQATLGAEGNLVLPIPATQIDDVLKSLLVVGVDGSSVSAITYTADEPLDRQLRRFGVDLQAVSGLADLLERMVGATVELHRGSERLQGQVIATEVVERTSREQVVRDEWLLLLTAEGSIERVELAAVRGLQVIKGELAGRMEAQLDLLQAARQPDVSRLVVTGTSGDALELSYVAEAPVWKMTYRVVLPAAAEEQPFLQGWAIAENTSATDWHEVDLALISGMPLSFTLDLAHPRFRSRPVARIPEVETIAPPVSEGMIMPPMMESMDVDAPATQYLSMSVAENMAGYPSSPPMAAMGGGRMARAAAPTAMAKSFNSNAMLAAPPPPTTTRTVGDLFEYHLDHPVTIPAQQAALIPVLAERVQGAAVSVYNAEVLPNHPLNAVRLTNSTSLTLDAGPLTVLREGTYVGEALIDVIKPGEERFVSYAVDLGCRVESEVQSGEGTRVHVRMSKGMLSFDLREVATTIYRLTSVTPDQRKVIIEHPVRAGWDEPAPHPSSTTPRFHRYEVDVPGKAGVHIAIRDSHTIAEHYALQHTSAEQVAWFLTQTRHDPNVRAVLEQVAAGLRTVQEREAIVNRLSAEINDITNDQARLRNNLQVLGQGREERDLARRYVDELGRSEDRIGQARNELATARQAYNVALEKLEDIVESAELDQPLQG